MKQQYFAVLELDWQRIVLLPVRRMGGEEK